MADDLKAIASQDEYASFILETFSIHPLDGLVPRWDVSHVDAARELIRIGHQTSETSVRRYRSGTNEYQGVTIRPPLSKHRIADLPTYYAEFKRASLTPGKPVITGNEASVVIHK